MVHWGQRRSRRWAARSTSSRPISFARWASGCEANVPAQEVLGLGPRGSAGHDQAADGDRFSAGRAAARGRARPGDEPAAPLLHAVSGVRRPGIGERAAAVRSAGRAGILRREAEYRAGDADAGRAFFSISSRRCAAIGWATTAAWRRSPAIRRSTARGATGFARCGGRSAWSIWRT